MVTHPPMQSTFLSHCIHGRLEEAQRLWAVAAQEINVSADDEFAFQNACDQGHLLVAQWLLTIKPDIDVSAGDECAFCLACEAGHLAVAQWLLRIKPNLNVSVDDDYAFCGACRGGHLDTARWLLHIQPDLNVSADDDYAFRCACANGRLEVAQWLLDVHPDDTWALTPDLYQEWFVPLFFRSQNWVDVAARVLALHPEWDPERADALGVGIPDYLLK